MIEWMKEFYTNPENIGEIVNGVVLFLIGVISPTIYKGVRILFKWLINLCWIGVKKVVIKSKSKLKKIKKNWDYKRKTGQIERQEIPVTDEFLMGRSPEKNPELRKIFQMMDDGVIETPPLYAKCKELRTTLSPELKEAFSNFSKGLAKNASQNVPKLKQPKIPPFDK